jgi:hypothetical protein
MDIRIDTLRLQVSDMNPDAARQFAQLVAERLGVALATWSAEPVPGLAGAELVALAGPAAGPDAGGPGPGRIGGLRVMVQARAWDSPHSLATHLAGEVSRAMRSASTPGGSAPAGGRAPSRSAPAARTVPSGPAERR